LYSSLNRPIIRRSNRRNRDGRGMAEMGSSIVNAERKQSFGMPRRNCNDIIIITDRNQIGRRLDSSWPETNSCEQGNKLLEFTKGGKFIYQLSDYHLLKKVSDSCSPESIPTRKGPSGLIIVLTQVLYSFYIRDWNPEGCKY
jgi:hypothetical protein